MHLCVDVQLCVAVWLCSCAAVWLCGGCVAVQLYSVLTIKKN
jgi:hypothetical protein